MKRARERGLSLVEMLIVIVLLTLVIGPLALIMQGSMTSQQRVVTENALQEKARAVADKIMESLLSGIQITAVDNNGFTVRYFDFTDNTMKYVKYYRNFSQDPYGRTLKQDTWQQSGPTTTTTLTDQLLGTPPGPTLFRYFQFQIQHNDNDGDGRIDEDPINNVDDDGDGRRDEDPVDYTFVELFGSNRTLADRIQIELVLDAGGQRATVRSSVRLRNKP
ncbi:MAG: type II secretion system protein [Abditibacteriales bacterium]|nr:type II secretion system protein [Abditibacteriales bacterium]